MKGNFFVHIVGILFFLVVGILFTFFAKQVREHYFKIYKEGIEKTGLLTSWIDKYPNGLVFRITGIIAIIISILLIVILIRKLQF